MEFRRPGPLRPVTGESSFGAPLAALGSATYDSPVSSVFDNDSRPPGAVHRTPLYGALIFLVAVAVYLPSLDAMFQLIDDGQYITTNPYVLYPSWGKLGAVFSEVLHPTTVYGYYQPLTMASLMLDRVVETAVAGGPSRNVDPFVFHLTQQVLHGACALLVFLVARSMTGRMGIAVGCGLLFAVHPLNVEAVSWISQRKALLSTMLALLTLSAYVRYARTRHMGWYWATVAAFVMSLLSKPTVLFMPVVLLLADVWPLRRFSRAAVAEKWPMYVAAVVGGWIAYASQTSAVDLSEAGEHRGAWATALVACHNLVFYAAKTVVPVRLCPQYLMPPEESLSIMHGPFLLGVSGTVGMVVWAWRSHRRGRTYVPVLLGSYALLIAPTLGPVRYTMTIAADRFAYAPMIPLILLAAMLGRQWLAPGVADPGARRRRGALTAIAAGLTSVLAVQTVRQQAVWQDAFAFFDAVLKRFPDDPEGHYGLGNAHLHAHDRLRAAGDDESQQEAAMHLTAAAAKYRRCLRLDPEYSYGHYRLGHILLLLGDAAGGIAEIQQGLSGRRADPEGFFFLGLAYTHTGEDAKAIEAYEICLARQPSWVEVRKNLANALLRTGRAAEAIPHYQRLCELDPTDMDGLQNWGVALLTIGDLEEAVGKLRAVVDVRSRMTAAFDGRRAATEADKLADARYTLAGALAMLEEGAAAMAELAAALSAKPELMTRAKAHPAFAELRQTSDWKAMERRLGGRDGGGTDASDG